MLNSLNGGNIPRNGVRYWIRFELDNGHEDMIVDYSTNLESIVAPLQAFAETL